MKNIRQLLGLAQNLRHFFVIIAFTSTVGALLGLATPYVIKLATDWIIAVTSGAARFDVSQIVGLVGVILAVSLLSTLVDDVGGFFGDQMSIRLRRQLSNRYYKHLLTLPQHYYDNEVTGTIISRLSRAITDITQFMQFFSNNLLRILLMIAITIVVLAFYSWPLAVLFVLLVPANLYLTARTSVKWQAIEKKKNKHFDIASGRFAEVVGQIRLVKSFGSEGRELKIFDSRMSKIVKLNAAQSRYWHSMNAIRSTVFTIIFAAIYALLFYLTAKRQLSVGEMVMLLTLVQQVSFPMRNLSYFIDSYQRAVANSRDYLAALAELPEPDETNAASLDVREAKVEYRQVSFAYTNKKDVLRDVSFAIEPGQKAALVGESGGGKTTISNLLMQLYRPSAGTILIDGHDIQKVNRRSLRESIATVFQDASLFSGTIRENIAYAKPDASDSEIEAAAKAANAYEFVEKFENGFDTEIGERGIKLSGGQKQRIAIARAILKDAPILILDEATSSLDGRSEQLVQGALNHLMKGRTTLIIAHRLSTIAHVDQIITVQDGGIDEVGPPQKLAKTGGIYSQLLDLQLGATEAAKERLQKFEIAE